MCRRQIAANDNAPLSRNNVCLSVRLSVVTLLTSLLAVAALDQFSSHMLVYGPLTVVEIRFIKMLLNIEAVVKNCCFWPVLVKYDEKGSFLLIDSSDHRSNRAIKSRFGLITNFPVAVTQ